MKRLPVPDTVAIVGLGPSGAQFLELARARGGRREVCDEVWTINALGDVFASDRIFHMDDVRIQEIRARAAPDSNIAKMLKWMRSHPGPIYTSRPHPDYPGLIEYPLEDVVNICGQHYLNSTAAHAVAYAVLIGVKKIACYGMDFTYPNAHDAEKGRACVEFWLGIAAARGIKLAVANRSSLLDAIAPPEERLYGYDTLDVSFRRTRGGRIKARFTEKNKLPTARQIEQRYDHSRHPNRTVEQEQSK